MPTREPISKHESTSVKYHSSKSSANKPTRRVNRNERVWAVVATIPFGKVVTYGQVAMLAQLAGPSGARQVGYALAALAADSDIPWHRVVNAKGELSPRADPDAVEFQLVLLESEGVAFDHRRCIDLSRYQWTANAKL
jgi:methylated-DNA-protein-cysteine methyltransferase related protein